MSRKLQQELEGVGDLFPVLPLKNMVALPRSIVPVIVGRDISVRAVEYALEHGKAVFIATQCSSEVQSPTLSDLYPVGTRGEILQVTRMQNGTLKVFVEAHVRARITQPIEGLPFLAGHIEEIPSEPLEDSAARQVMVRMLYELFKEYVELSDRAPRDVLALFKGSDDLDLLVDTVGMHLQIKLEDRQAILACAPVLDRAQLVIGLLKTEIEIIKTEHKIRKRVQSQVEKHQKDYYLQEQMRAIQRELGKDGILQEVQDLRKRAKKLKLPSSVQEKVDLELNRLEQMQSSSPEASVSRTYIEWVLALPWSVIGKDRVSLPQAEKILDRSHASMKKPKERILEFIATKKFAKDALKRSPVICLVGPPGVGKTTLARSIAEALDREFVRISLGGVRDEAEIRGHRRTYIGAMPGKIIQAMRRAKTSNPVLLLDEIDKMAMDFRGDPASALLEVLDPELNKAFVDHYLEVDYDLSKVLFIATANVIDNIPYPLLDRMEVIQLAGYTLLEKVNIAREFLLPRLLEEHALTKKQFTISNDILTRLIDEYTKEAGVRQLERVLAKLIRKTIQELLGNEHKKSVDITWALIELWLGAPKFKRPELEIADRVGVAMGLAWTEVGGDMLEIEVTIMKGKGSLQLTGQLGEVMRESAEAALSYVRSRAKDFGLSDDFYTESDIHIHVPEGSIPKDGPSAGITMTVALISALTKVPVKRTVAMTGEVTLRGRVLAVGGLKEKLLAAMRFGCTEVIVPKENMSDIREFESELGGGLTITYADHMDTVIAHAFVQPPIVGSISKAPKRVSRAKTSKTSAKSPAKKNKKTK